MSGRDRHGRGLRRPLLSPDAPGRRNKRESFDDAVAACASSLEKRWGNVWGAVEFAVEEVPRSAPAAWETGIPLGRLFPADAGQPARIVVYRKPIEQRAIDREDLRGLVRDVITENVAHVLGKPPHEVDPAYGS